MLATKFMLTFIPIVGSIISLTSASITVSHCQSKVSRLSVDRLMMPLIMDKLVISLSR